MSEIKIKINNNVKHYCHYISNILSLAYHIYTFYPILH